MPNTHTEDSNLTPSSSYDILNISDDIPDIYYKSWEEIPVSTLQFNGKTAQIVYVALSREEALKAINTQSLPVKTLAYEYRENINLKDNQVIIGVAIDTKNMLDATNIKELSHIMKSDLDVYIKENNVSLIRKIENRTIKLLTVGVIVYLIIDNRAVKAIYKF